MVTEYQVDPTGAFRESVSKAIEEVDDLRIPYGLITKSWFQGNKAIFALKGPGKFTDLDPATKKIKSRTGSGEVYPILFHYGLLAASLTDPSDSNAIAMIVGKYSLVLGTDVPYARHLQYGTKKMKVNKKKKEWRMPPRPVVIWGSEQTAPDELNKRVQIWTEIIKDYCLKVAAKLGKVKP